MLHPNLVLDIQSKLFTVNLLLYFSRIYIEAQRHRRAMRRHSVPLGSQLCVIPSTCSLGVVTPTSYSMGIMIGGKRNHQKEALEAEEANVEYEALKKASQGRRMSDSLSESKGALKSIRRLSIQGDKSESCNEPKEVLMKSMNYQSIYAEKVTNSMLPR